MILKIDEEFKSLIPPLTAEEFVQLKENIMREGCRDALVTWGDILIDGHNRYQICTDNEIEFQTVDKQFDSRSDVIAWIIRNQFGRRNLSMFDRGVLALRLKPILEEKAKGRQSLAGGDKKSAKSLMTNWSEPISQGTTRKALAEISGTSEGTIARVETIVTKGTPEQIERARKGEAVSKICNEIKGIPETKTCSICSQEKPISEFYGRATECKSCQSTRKSAGLTMAKTRELNEKYPDELLNSYYEEMRNHNTPSEDLIASSKNVLANELKELLHDFNISINKFLFSENLLKDETFLKPELSETINNLNKINDFIKEDM